MGLLSVVNVRLSVVSYLLVLHVGNTKSSATSIHCVIDSQGGGGGGGGGRDTSR